MKLNAIYIVIIIILLSGACKIGQEYNHPVMDVPDYLDSTQVDTISLAESDWRAVYSDSTLADYIEIALENNRDMKIAAAKVQETMALSRISTSRLLPKIGIEGEKYQESYSYSDLDKSNYLSGVVFWELDLWGNLRWGRDAAIAEYTASKEGKKAVQLALIAAVAESYLELISLQRELAIVKNTVKARKEGVELANLRFESGLTSKTALMQAMLEHASAKALVPDLETNIKVAENNFSALLGQMPHEYDNFMNVPSWGLNDSLKPGLSSYFLKRRPDIQIAEQELIAANAHVGIAITNRFPKIALTAKYGMESADLSSFISSPYSYLAGNLLAPIFEAGANKAKVKASKAVFEQQLYKYEQTVYNAFAEVNSAIYSYYKSHEVIQLRKEYLASAQQYLELAQLQYLNGIINYIDVLDAQRQLFEAEIRLNNSYQAKLLSYVYLYKALGGGW